MCEVCVVFDPQVSYSVISSAQSVEFMKEEFKCALVRAHLKFGWIEEMVRRLL